MDVALYAASLGLFLVGYWLALNRLAPIAVRSGQLAIFGVWLGGWFVGIFVAGLPTAFVGGANWAFAVGIALAGAIDTLIFGRSAWRLGRAQRLHQDRPG